MQDVQILSCCSAALIGRMTSRVRPSVRPSVVHGLLARTQKNARKTELGANIPQCSWRHRRVSFQFTLIRVLYVLYGLPVNFTRTSSFCAGQGQSACAVQCRRVTLARRTVAYHVNTRPLLGSFSSKHV